MKRTTASATMLLLLLTGVLTLTFNLWLTQASPEPTLYLDPSNTVDPTLTPGNSFTLAIMVSDVNTEMGCYSWQVNLSWNPSVLRFTEVVEGDFLKDQPEGTFGGSQIEESWALFGWTTIGEHLGVKGSGTLATVEFLVLDIGESVIRIDNPRTYLLGLEESPPPPPPVLVEMPSMKENGYFSNIGAVVLPCTVDVRPQALNLKSKGRWIEAHLKLPENYDVSDIDISTVRLNGVVPAELHPSRTGESNAEGISRLIVRFNRQDVIAALGAGEATLSITGEVNGVAFAGTDTIKLIVGKPLSSFSMSRKTS